MSYDFAIIQFYFHIIKGSIFQIEYKKKNSSYSPFQKAVKWIFKTTSV